MKRLTAFALGGLPLGGLVGCGDKPAPVIEARPIDKPKAQDAELKPPPRPAASDPAARAVLDDMLAAHTAGQPDRLAALRECSFTRSGQADTQVGRVRAVWKRDLIWPDRYRIRTEMSDSSGNKKVLNYALRGDTGWGQPGDDPNPKAKADADTLATIRSQLHEDALTLLFVLADPKTLAARGPDEQAGEKELTTLDVWTPAGDHARLGVDKKTKLLARILYLGREGDAAVTKELTFQEYKEFGGVKLGSKMYAQTRAKPLGEWTELTVELAKPDAKLFDGP
jgi:hypothetical protein